MTYSKTFKTFGAAVVLSATLALPAVTQAQTLSLRISG